MQEKSSKNLCHKFNVNEHKLVTQLVFGLMSMASWKGSPLWRYLYALPKMLLRGISSSYAFQKKTKY